MKILKIYRMAFDQVLAQKFLIETVKFCRRVVRFTAINCFFIVLTL